MNRFILTFIILSVTWYCGLQAYAQNSFSLEQAVQYAIKNSSETQKDLNRIADANAQMKALMATGLPQINGSAEYQYFVEVPEMVIPKEFDPTGQGGTISFQKPNNLSFGLSGSMRALDGSYLVAIKAAKFYKEFTLAQTEITPVTIRKNVTDAYYTVLIAQKSMTQLEKNIEVMQIMKKDLEQIFKNGLNEKVDIDRIDLSISNLTSTINNLKRNIEILKNVLKFQMHYPIESAIELTDNFDDAYKIASNDNEKAIEKLNIERRPEYRAIGKGIELAGMNIERYQKSYLPSMSIFGSFSRGLQADNLFAKGGYWIPTSVVGATLSIPIYDSGLKKANIQKAKIVVEQNKIDRNDFVRATELEVDNTQKAYLNALATVEEKQKSLDLAQEIFRIAQVKFKEGIGSSFETTQAETDLYAAQSSLIQAQGEVITSRFAIQKALGNFE